jgi:hypothetical protein
MSRSPRFTYAHAVHHVTLRCNNREFLFAEPSFQLFLDVLQEARGLFPLSPYNRISTEWGTLVLKQLDKGEE